MIIQIEDTWEPKFKFNDKYYVANWETIFNLNILEKEECFEMIELMVSAGKVLDIEKPIIECINVKEE